MQAERMTDFNQQSEFTTAVDVTFDWKLGAGYKVDFNAFFPEVLVNLNLKTPAFYELLNPMPQLAKEEDITHATKAHSEWTLVENVIRAEEILDLAQMQMHTLLTKTQDG